MKKLFKVFGIVFSLFLGLFVLASCGGGLSKSIIEQEAVVSVNENKLQVVLKQKDHTKIQNALEVKATSVRVTLVNGNASIELPLIYLKDDDSNENKEYVKLLPTTKEESKYDTNEKVYLDGLAFKFTIDLNLYYEQTNNENKEAVFAADRPVQVIVNLRKGTEKVSVNAEYKNNYISISKTDNNFTFTDAEKYTAAFVEGDKTIKSIDAFIGYTAKPEDISSISKDGWKLGEKEIENISAYVFDKADLVNDSFTFTR